MDRGTYAAASAGLANMIRLEVVSNNLANVNTPGFKRQFVEGSKQDFESTLAAEVKGDPYTQGDHERVSGIVSLRTVTDFSQGPIINTGNTLDVALRNKNDFLVVAGPNGPLYTRAGNFSLDESGNLVTADGLPVQGDGGAITVPENGLLSITESGEVFAGEQSIAKLQVVHIEDTSGLKRTDGARFEANGPVIAETVPAAIVPKALEMANVTSIGSIVELMTVNRGFQSYVKMAQSIDELNRIAVTDLARG